MNSDMRIITAVVTEPEILSIIHPRSGQYEEIMLIPIEFELYVSNACHRIIRRGIDNVELE